MRAFIRGVFMSSNPHSTLTLDVDRQPAVTIVRCAGKVLLDSIGDFSAVRDLIPEGKPIRVDLSSVTQVDSTGIGAFVSVWAAAKKNGVDLKFMKPNKAVADLVEITKLHHIFEDGEYKAVKAPGQD
jgi:anti-sigma B factor antagonist